MKKYKVLQSFNSVYMSGVEGEVVELPLDEYTINNWIENGLIEEVKPKSKKVTDNENK